MSDVCSSDLDIALWAVHPGGRTVLDAVEASFALAKDRLAHSRQVLNDYGNMSSGTVMFVLDSMMRAKEKGRGLAMAFGPGLVAETMRSEEHTSELQSHSFISY